MKTQFRVYMVLSLVLLFSLLLGGCNVINNKVESDKLELEGDEKAALSLTLALDKTVYTSDQTIEATVILKNIGNRVVTVNTRMAVMLIPALNNEGEVWGELLFVFESPSGNRVSNNGNWRIRRIFESDFMVLPSRRGILGLYELRQYFVLDEIGAYLVHVVYQNLLDSPKGSVAWKGQITSNTVVFEVEP